MHLAYKSCKPMAKKNKDVLDLCLIFIRPFLLMSLGILLWSKQKSNLCVFTFACLYDISKIILQSN